MNNADRLEMCTSNILVDRDQVILGIIVSITLMVLGLTLYKILQKCCRRDYYSENSEDERLIYISNENEYKEIRRRNK